MCFERWLIWSRDHLLLGTRSFTRLCSALGKGAPNFPTALGSRAAVLGGVLLQSLLCWALERHLDLATRRAVPLSFKAGAAQPHLQRQ